MPDAWRFVVIAGGGVFIPKPGVGSVRPMKSCDVALPVIAGLTIYSKVISMLILLYDPPNDVRTIHIAPQ